MKRLGFALSMHLVCAGLVAQEAPIEAPSPCRALFSTTAGITEAGVAELEFGAQHATHRDGSDATLFPAQVNLGLASWVDLRLGWSGHNRLRDGEGRCAEGFGDPQIGGQLLFAPQDKLGVDVGLSYWHKIPRASVEKGIGSGRHDDSAMLVLTHTQGHWMVDVNAGANWVGRAEGGRVRQSAASLCITWLTAPGWNLSLDTYAVETTELAPKTVSSILALSRRMSPNLTVDVAVEAGLNQAAPKLALNAGLVWRMGRIWN